MAPQTTQKIKIKQGDEWQFGPGIRIEVVAVGFTTELKVLKDPGYSVAKVSSRHRMQIESSREKGNTEPSQS